MTDSTQVLQLGDTISNFSLPATGAQTVTQNHFKNTYTVLYFYPKDSTPGCTTEGLEFSALHTQFKSLNTQIFGVSMDSMRRHENFKAKQHFPFELISDEQAQLCTMFGVYQLKKNFGKEYMGIVRSTFLIDPAGKIIHHWPKVKVNGHAQEVLETLQQLQA